MPDPIGDVNSDGILNVSERWRYEFNITITEPSYDFCGGWINNTVIANFSTNRGTYIERQSWANVTIDYNSSISIAKEANVSGPVSPGDVIEYTIIVCNTGNLSLKDVVVFDNLTGSYVVGDLPKDGCNTTKQTYTVTERDLCDGSVTNYAYATAIDYCDKPLVTLTNATLALEVDYNSSISIAKEANVSGPVSPGDVIEYTIIVCNTGNLSLKDVVVFDNLTGSYVVGDLPKDGCNTTKQTYTVTERDLCDGSVTNYAYATAIDYCDKPLVTLTNATLALEVDYNSSISIAKEANVSGPVSPGDVIEYTIIVCNTGNLSLKDVVVFDNLTGSYVVGDLPKDGCNTTKQTYTVTERDLCDGSVTNYAYATAIDYCDKPLVTLTNATLALEVDYNSSISIAKEANVSGPVSPGDVIEYTIIVCNTGNLSLKDVVVFDNLTGSYVVGDLPKDGCNTTKQTYTVTERDLCDGSVTNYAYATAIDYCDKPLVTLTNATLALEVDYNSSISIAKEANVSGPVSPGDVIEYTIIVCNTGNLSLKDVVVFDNLTGSYVVGDLPKDGCNTTKQTYTVTERDLCDGSVTNYAYATAIDYCDKPLVTLTNATLALEVDYNSSISIAKEANVSGPVSPGDVIEYTIIVCNTGNLSLKDVVVFDNLTGSYVVGDLPKDGCNTTKQTYTVTERDLCDGSVTNYAYATAIDYCDKPLVTLTNATLALEVDYNSSISIAKEANVSGPVSPGDVIEYTIIVCNTGNLSLKDVVVFDNLTGSYVVGDLPKDGCNTTKQTYTVTERDLCDGSVTNYAYATAIDYCDKPLVTLTNATLALEVDYNSSISIAKEANVSGPVSPGDVIEYTIIVCNTGNLSLKDVVVFDNLTGSYVVGDLPKDGCNTTKQTYTVTERDLCDGSVTNYAYATAIDYCDKPLVTLTNATVDLDVDYNSSISIVKWANVSGPVSPGDVIEYTITVCNTGNLSLKDVEVFDNLTGSYVVGDLPIEDCNITKQIYTVTEEDICYPIVNLVKVNSTDICGKEVEDMDINTVLTVCKFCISGHKYWDKNGDGFKDPEDTPLKNWTIQIWSNNTLVNETKTGDDGYWEACDLIPGLYNVSEVVQDGWIPTYPPGGYHYPIEIVSDNVTGVDFLNTGIFCISGHKYWDKEADGKKGPLDEPLPGWVIFIAEDGDRNVDPCKPVTTTGGDGFWEICNLPPGTYTVCEEMMPGWIQTYPQESGCHTVDIIDQSVMGLDFLNHRPSNELWNEDLVHLGDQFASARDLSTKGGLAKNLIEIEKTQTQKACGMGTDLFNFQNISIEDQRADSTGPGISSNTIRIVTSQS
uniref:DUF7507 domain-containing protein n=1 Tax=Candidatus Methanocrinis natronophilus TaxID=3033396 RepID=UPI002934D2F5|nr:hypothetical protein [Candidatus Methanocrinis natronophilus]